MASNKANSVFKQKIIDDYNAVTTQSDLCQKCRMSKPVLN